MTRLKMNPLMLFALLCATIHAQVTINAASSTGADASAKINNCVISVITAGGGECDATGIFGGLDQTTGKPIPLLMSKEIDNGNAYQVAHRIEVVLKLPATAIWAWHLTDGVSCGIRQFSNTVIEGPDGGGGGERMILASAGNGTNMDSLYCTDTAGTYVRAKGFAVENWTDSVFTNGLIHIRDVADNSSFVDIFSYNRYGDDWHIDSACCGARFTGIQGGSNGLASLTGHVGGVPLTIGPGPVRGIGIYDSIANGPGVGHPDVLIFGGAETMSVTFYNLYMEGNGQVDLKTPMVEVAQNVAGPISFFGGMANTLQPFINNTVANTKYIFSNFGANLIVEGFATGNTTLGIKDTSRNTTVAVTPFGNTNLGYIPAYVH